MFYIYICIYITALVFLKVERKHFEELYMCVCVCICDITYGLYHILVGQLLGMILAYTYQCTNLCLFLWLFFCFV